MDRPKDKTDTPSRLGMWIAAWTSLALVLVAAAALGGYVWAGQRVWTDAAGRPVADDSARVRDVVWDQPVDLGPPVNSARIEQGPSLSLAEGELYFARQSADGNGMDLMVSQRTENGWGQPERLEHVNTPYDEVDPRVTPDGRWLLLASNRPTAEGGYDLYAAPRTATGWDKPVNLGPSVNSAADERTPCQLPDGSLVFATTRESPSRNTGGWDLVIAPPVKSDSPGEFTMAFLPARLLAGINSPSDELGAAVTAEGDLLYFASNRPGGRGRLDLYRGRIDGRVIRDIEHLGDGINGPGDETNPTVALAGLGLIFTASPADGNAPTDLMLVRSREVFAGRRERALPRLHWSTWALVVGIAMLIPLLLFLKAADYRHFSLLQKCVALSVLAHVLITTLLGFMFVSVEVIDYIAEEAGLKSSVNLELSRVAQMRSEMRRINTDPVPVTDPRQADLKPLDTELEPRSAPQPAEQKLPESKPDASVRNTSAPPMPPHRNPRDLSEPEEKPKPTDRERLDPVVAAPTPIRREEQRPRTPQQQPEQLASKDAEIKIQRATTDDMETVEPVETRRKADIQAAAPPARRPREIDPDKPPAEIPTPAIPVDNQTMKIRRVQGQEPNAPAEQNARLAQAEASPNLGNRPATDVSEDAAEDALPAQRSLKPAPSSRRRPEADTTPQPDVRVELAQIDLEEPAGKAADSEPVVLAATRQLETADSDAPAREGLARLDEDLLADIKADDLPLKRSAESLIRQPVADQARKPAADETSHEKTPKAVLLPMEGKLDPGKLASPPAFVERSVEMRPKLIRKFGGSEKSEAAVDRALKFLARSQQKDGRWTRFGDRLPKRNRKEPSEADSALTGLAVLCFLARNHTHADEGEYQETVNSAVNFLVEQQESDGDLSGTRSKNYHMYNQGIATLALAEAAAMTGDYTLKQAALKGARYIIKGQTRSTGGWRYLPNYRDSDTSVFGWQVMALHSTEGLGLEIPDRTRKGAMKWLAKCSSGREGMLASYQKGKPTPTMTAEAVFSRILLGQDLNDRQKAAAGKFIFNDRALRSTNYYYWYYASMALMQMGGDRWEKWNAKIRDHLIKKQNTRGGDLDGSWDDKSKWASRGGRVYTTTMATLTLEVYYRYLPMLQTDDEKK